MINLKFAFLFLLTEIASESIAGQSLPNIHHLFPQKKILGSLSGSIQQYLSRPEKKKIKILNQFFPVLNKKYCFTLEDDNSNQFTFHFLHENQIDTVFGDEKTNISRIITHLYSLIFVKKISDALTNGDKAQAAALTRMKSGKKRIEAAKDFVSYIEKNNQNLQEILPPHSYKRFSLIETIERERDKIVERTINWAKAEKVGVERCVNALERAHNNWAHQYDAENDRFSLGEMQVLRASILHYAREIASQIINSYDVQWTHDETTMFNLMSEATQSAMNLQNRRIQCVLDDESIEAIEDQMTSDNLPSVENIEDVVDFNVFDSKK